MQQAFYRMSRIKTNTRISSRLGRLYGLRRWLSLLWLIATPPVALAQASPDLATTTGVIQSSAGATGVIQLRDTTSATGSARTDASSVSAAGNVQAGGGAPVAAAVPYKAGEFERYVQKLPGASDVRRLGIDLLGSDSAGEVAGNPLVPDDYLVQTGDELALVIWGSVDADLRLQVDRAGRISIPRVGTIMVSGVRYGELTELISRRVAQVFKNFQLSVSLGRLRGMRVFVTGFATRPGVLMVNSLSTLSQALLRAGGPASSGSFRNVQLKRGRNLVATFDLYDLLLNGDRSNDRLLQPDDVIHVGPVGPLIAMIGSVNRPAIFELKAGENVDDALRMAGGFSAVADTSRLAVERMADHPGRRVVLATYPESARQRLDNGDVLRAFNSLDIMQSTVPRNKRVRVEGEVSKPGEYVLPPDSSIADALAIAGGVTRKAFLFGTEFTRESVRATQRQNYEQALRDFETDLLRAPLTQRTSTADEASANTALGVNGARLMEKLRSVQPTGRLVLQLQPNAQSLPDMALEDGDRLYIPAQPTTVGVFGSVFSGGSYLHSSGRTIGEYLRLAGGPTRRADENSVFVVRANGTVTSSLSASSWFSRGNQVSDLVAEPGDTIFVPDEINSITWTQGAKDWTQILYQFGLGVAGLKSALK